MSDRLPLPYGLPGRGKKSPCGMGAPPLDLSWDPGRVRLAGNMYVVPGEASLAVPSGGRSLWARDEEYRFWIVLGQFI